MAKGFFKYQTINLYIGRHIQTVEYYMLKDGREIIFLQKKDKKNLSKKIFHPLYLDEIISQDYNHGIGLVVIKGKTIPRNEQSLIKSVLEIEIDWSPPKRLQSF